MIQGPDPDKNDYRFVINGQMLRWYGMRSRVYTIMGEAAIAEIDQELKEMTQQQNIDDATHAKDLAATLKKRLDDIDRLLGGEVSEATNAPLAEESSPPPPGALNVYRQQITREAMQRDNARMRAKQAEMIARAKANAASNKGVSLEEALNTAHRDLNKWRFMPLHREIADASAVLQLANSQDASPTTCAADVRITSPFTFDGRVRIVWKKGSPFQEALDEANFNGLNSVQLSFELDQYTPNVRLRTHGDPASEEWAVSLELVEVTKQTGPRTALPGLPVRVPETMPGEDADLLGESREEMEARLAQVAAIAGVYQKEVDPRDPVRISMDDLTKAESNRRQSPTQAVAGWSDNPKTARDIEGILKALYVGAGMAVESVTINGDVASIVLDHPPRAFAVPLPPELKALLSSGNAPPRR